MITFCCMPPEKVSRLASEPVGRKAELAEKLRDPRPALAVAEAEAPVLADMGEEEVLLHRQVRDDVLRAAILGDEADAEADRLCRRPRIDGASVHREWCRRRGAGGRRAPLPSPSGRRRRGRRARAPRPAGRRRKRRARMGSEERLATSSTVSPSGTAFSASAPGVDGAELLADHVPDDVGLAERGGLEVARHRGALAHHGHPVGDRRAPPRAGGRRR